MKGDDMKDEGAPIWLFIATGLLAGAVLVGLSVAIVYSCNWLLADVADFERGAVIGAATVSVSALAHPIVIRATHRIERAYVKRARARSGDRT